MQWRAKFVEQSSVTKCYFFYKQLETQYLFQIFQTSLTINNSENVVKSGVFRKTLAAENDNSFSNAGGL